MRLISPALRHFIYPALAKSGYLRRRNGVGPTVVTYHGVLPAGYRMVDAVLDGNLVSTNTLRCQLQLRKPLTAKADHFFRIVQAGVAGGGTGKVWRSSASSHPLSLIHI